MTITLPLQPQEEATLLAVARAKGVSASDLIQEAVQRIISEAPVLEKKSGSEGIEPTRSLRGILAKYGPAPSADDIDRNRAEMFANFPCDDI